MSPIPQQTPAQQAEALRLRAEAVVLARKKAGTWTGALKAHEEYQTRPLEWIVEYLGIPEESLRWSRAPEYQAHSWDGDPDPLIKVLDCVAADKDCAVESGTGTGKTFALALIVLWAMATHEDALVLTVAPRSAQLLLNVWKEIGRLWPRFQRHFPTAELLTGKIRMRGGTDDKEGWAATALVAGVGADEEVAQKMAGFHGPYMLWITEETPGIHPAIMNAIANTRTGSRNPHLAVGNPDHQQDPLHKLCLKPWVTAVRISALDHPNVVTGRDVIPGAVGRKSVEERRLEYGEGHRLFQSRVRGISPTEAEDALIMWDWCVAASKRYHDPDLRRGLPARGVDVAQSEAGDKAAISRWEGACCTEVVSFFCQDASVLGEDVVVECRASGVDQRHVGVDSVGVGASTMNQMRRMKFKARGISGGTRAAPGLDVDAKWSATREDEEGRTQAAGPTVVEAERYDNTRTQAWWRMREDLRQGRIALPYDEELFRDLTTPTWGTDNGKIWVESKTSMFDRLRRSPDKGDACVYGNFVRPRVPVTPTATEKPVESADRDLGLERLLRDHAKAQRAMVREWQRERRA